MPGEEEGAGVDTALPPRPLGLLSLLRRPGLLAAVRCPLELHSPVLLGGGGLGLVISILTASRVLRFLMGNTVSRTAWMTGSLTVFFLASATAATALLPGFRPRFLGTAWGSDSGFRLRPGRLITMTCAEVVAPPVPSAFAPIEDDCKGILTSSFPELFSITLFTCTPSEAVPLGLVEPLPLGRPRPRPVPVVLGALVFLGGFCSRREGLPRPVTVKSKSLGSREVSPTFSK